MKESISGFHRPEIYIGARGEVRMAFRLRSGDALVIPFRDLVKGEISESAKEFLDRWAGDVETPGTTGGPR